MTTDKEPLTYFTEDHAASMTLRDYFAAKAMQAELQDGVHIDAMPTVAKRAYKMADAMLEARNDQR